MRFARREVHAIADDWRENPISRWTVRDVHTGEDLAKVVSCDGDFRMEPVDGGPAETYQDFRDARDAAAWVGLPSTALH